jgi:predicted DsbA family dithiol-disulfide isomerase
MESRHDEHDSISLFVPLRESERDMSMKVEIWSDVVCPWCYIGKRRFESALAGFEQKDQVEVHWRSYQLDPGAQSSSDLTLNEMLSAKYGVSLQQATAMNARVSSLAAGEGLEYHLERAHPANTFDAHRLIHLAEKHGLQDTMKERLLKAYFSEAQSIGELETLVALASEVGLDTEEAREALLGDAYADEVQADIALAAELGITGVPFFVIDEKYGISGAQSTNVFQQALKQAWQESHPLITLASSSEESGSCEGESCAIQSN